MNAIDIEAIRKETQKMEDALFKPGETPPVAPAETPPVVPTTPSESPVETPATPPTETPPVESPPTEPPVTPSPDVPPTEPPATPPTPQPIESLGSSEDFEHKYKVLQGKYNKELKEVRNSGKEASDRVIALEYERGQLQGQVRDLTSRLERLEMGETLPASTKQVGGYDPEKDPDALYIKKEFPELWNSLLPMFKKSNAAAIAEATGRIERVESEVKGVAEQSKASAKTSFQRYLDDNVDGWRTVDVDPEFSKWLNTPAPYTNIPKRALIEKAIKEFDAVTTSKFFLDFANEHSQVDDGNTPPATTPKPKPMVTPGPVTPPKPLTPPLPPRRANTEIITTDEITKFYEDRMHGKYEGKDVEMLAYEKRIEKAVAEGRVK